MLRIFWRGHNQFLKGLGRGGLAAVSLVPQVPLGELPLGELPPLPLTPAILTLPKELASIAGLPIMLTVTGKVEGTVMH